MVETKLDKLTSEDYLNTSDDERWEILDGELFMAPAPNTAHQAITGNLYWHLRALVQEKGLGRVLSPPSTSFSQPTTWSSPTSLLTRRCPA